MDLKKLALVAEIVGGIGIVISVLYLAYEISQNTANLKAANAMSFATEINARRFARVENGELDALIQKGQTELDSLTDEERSRFFSYVLVRFTLLDNFLYMDDSDLLPPEYADTILRGYCASLSSPGYRAIWASSLASFYSERLRNFMQECYAN
jgi:hypothetical protein